MFCPPCSVLAFVWFRKKGEQHFHLLSALLHAAKVVDDQAREAKRLFDHFRQTQIAFRDQQLLVQHG